ncbi:MAG: WxcM-like domain-containing protein [Deltaproteobacteria bacterium]|nr:WxcM-like domain-containing protein [Deltaproteobacteria bacterium]
MLKFIKPYFMYEDKRGALEGLINFGEWKEINLISSLAGIERGNHYHKETLELFIILEGKINVIVQKVKDGKLLGSKAERIVKGGDVFLIDPFINHTFRVLNDAKWINVLSTKIDPQNPDIHRTLSFIES